nr:hypothetical protein [Escherichia coli]
MRIRYQVKDQLGGGNRRRKTFALCWIYACRKATFCNVVW